MTNGVGGAFFTCPPTLIHAIIGAEAFDCSSQRRLGVELMLLVVAALYIGAAAWLAWWMLEPMNRVAGTLQFSTRFMLTDVIGLMIMLQVPLAIVGRAVESGREQNSSPYWVLVTVFAVLALVLWAASVSVVSRAGITRLTRRLVVILLLVPGALGV